MRKPKVLIPEVKIQERIQELAYDINQDYANSEITALCILKGSFIFFSDLIRHLEPNISCEFLGLSSYGNDTTSSGEVKVTLDINQPIENRHVLIIEDIVDTGLTLNYIISTLQARKPASIQICSLLFKPQSMKIPLDIQYVGFEIGNEFAIGYGLDYAEKYRGLPYIGYFENEN